MKIKEIGKRAAAAGTAMLCAGLLCKSAMADGPSTDVWLDVVKGPSLARISVTVPIAYGFAVYGTMVSADNTPISVANGNLLLSNVKIVVDNPTSSTSSYQIQVEGSQSVPLRNYSTDVREADLSLANPPRVGLAVRVTPYIIAPRDTLGAILPASQRYYWEPVAAQPTSALVDFKKFRMSLDSKKFSYSDPDDSSVIYLENNITLPIPPDIATNGYTASGTANEPSVFYADVDVEVGGQRGQYSQVEQSVKVGMINWLVEPVPETP